MLKVLFFIFLYIISFSFEIIPKCEEYCDKRIYMEAIIFYIKMPGDETLIKKNEANPYTDPEFYDHEKCTLEHINSFIKCMGQVEESDINIEEKEKLFLREYFDEQNCYIDISEHSFLNIFISLNNEPNKFNLLYYQMAISIKKLSKSIPKYKSNLRIIQKILCHSYKIYLKNNPDSILNSDIIDKNSASDVMSKIMEIIKKNQIVLKQLKCLNVPRYVTFEDNNLMKINNYNCPVFEETDSDSDSLVRSLYPFNEEKPTTDSTSVSIIESESSFFKEEIHTVNITSKTYSKTSMTINVLGILLAIIVCLCLAYIIYKRKKSTYNNTTNETKTNINI